MNSYISNMDSPIGIIKLAALDDGLVYCASEREDGSNMVDWLKRYLPDYELVDKENKIIKEAKKQLKEYFEGKLRKLEIPMVLIGTEFRKTVWEALKTIPYGETRSYGEIAKQIGKPKGPRAVGQANHHNPISYFIP